VVYARFTFSLNSIESAFKIKQIEGFNMKKKVWVCLLLGVACIGSAPGAYARAKALPKVTKPVVRVIPRGAPVVAGSNNFFGIVGGLAGFGAGAGVLASQTNASP
jgi:hypothetical protein